MIFDLPDVILYQIRDFIIPNHEGNEFCIVERSKNETEGTKIWGNFMNTTKLFLEIKRKTIYLVLNDSLSFNYLRNEQFRHRVDSLIGDKREQLHIIWKKKERLETAAWDGCHTLSIYSKTPDFSIFFNVKILRLHDSKNAILSNMMNLETLSLESCYEIQEIRNCPRITQLFARSCPKLRHVSDLTGLVFLHVTGCPRVILEERTLLQVQHLWLDDQSGIFTDASPDRFQNVRNLHLQGHVFVLDELWLFTRLTSLSLHRCSEIDITGTPHCFTNLEFADCGRFIPPDLSEIDTLRNLVFKNCDLNHYVLDLPYNLNKLIFRRCCKLSHLYLHSSAKDLIIDDTEDDGLDPIFDTGYMTLYLKKGVFMPKITMKVNLKIYIKMIC